MPLPRGGGLTVMVIGADGVTARPLSRALATNVCGPTGAFDQTKPKPAVVASPSLIAPSKNSTRSTSPSGSEASTVSGMLTGTSKLAPFVGEVNAISGD